MDRETLPNGEAYCTARSGHAAEVIQKALNSWIKMGPTKMPKMTAEGYAQLRRLKAMAKKQSHPSITIGDYS
jgi:hypothetical protein